MGDLIAMTRNNLQEGFIHYIAGKTKGETPKEIRVPLSPSALALIAKYKEPMTDGRLMPFISEVKYNEALKEIFRTAGIDRFVTRLNPTTGKPEQVKICDIASSHMARRTFCGNLYKKVQDPNLVGSLSGHAEGSKAFARYRDIDEDLKRSLIDQMGY